ncbi:MAG TPA: TIGR03013 family XrtA/PEP-CTERM system glycosyltransferase [Candidatus Binatia bacterium]|nr:TIGR03013 family XrtA/PEP-CTERM system glycosyltransferase [Candidatus Binatia bacterium]
MLRVFRHYIPAAALTLLAGDVLLIAGAVWLARATGGWPGYGALWPKVLVVTGVAVFNLHLADLYRPRSAMGRREVVGRLLLALAGTGVGTAAASYAFPSLGLGRLVFLQTIVLTSSGLLLWRLAWVAVRPTDRMRTRVLVLGTGRAVNTLVALQRTGSQPFTVLGFVDDDPAAAERVPQGYELLGKSQDLLNIVEELQAELVVVALADMRGAVPTAQLVECRLRGIRVEDWPTFYEKQTGKILVTDLRPSWLIYSDGFVKTTLVQRVKRGIDVVGAAVGLVLTLPLMLLIALAIKCDSRGPVLFRQRRVGQNGRIFVLNKFRSMRQDAEAGSGAVWAQPDDPRVTRVGRLLRKTRLDELPQLFNVLVGHMSFVGPRPERPEFVRLLQREIPFYLGRLAVKPGITGWAQVRHTYAASVDDTLEKLQYDLYYIKNLSPFLDLLIVLDTLQVMLFARGAR